MQPSLSVSKSWVVNQATRMARSAGLKAEFVWEPATTFSWEQISVLLDGRREPFLAVLLSDLMLSTDDAETRKQILSDIRTELTTLVRIRKAS